MEENCNQQKSNPAFEVIECIEKDGWKIVHLRDSSGIIYTHTVGLYERFNIHELIISDVSLNDSHKLFSIIIDKCIESGVSLENAKNYHGILEVASICTLCLNSDLSESLESGIEPINFDRNLNSKFYEGINPKAKILCLFIRIEHSVMSNRGSYSQLESINKLFDLDIDSKYKKVIDNGPTIHVH